MKRFLFAAAAFSSIASAALAGGAGGGGSLRVALQEQAYKATHLAVCALDGNKLVLAADHSKPCPNQ